MNDARVAKLLPNTQLANDDMRPFTVTAAPSANTPMSDAYGRGNPVHVPVLFRKVQFTNTGEPSSEITRAFTAFAIVRPVMLILAVRESHVVPGQENVAAPVPISEYVPARMV
jgi:hypothetical protein